jgi:hypothetical protein
MAGEEGGARSLTQCRRAYTWRPATLGREQRATRRAALQTTSSTRLTSHYAPPEQQRPHNEHADGALQQSAENFFAYGQAAAGADLPQNAHGEFDALLERCILAEGILRLGCGCRSRDKLVAFSCKRRRFCPPCGARSGMAQSATNLVGDVVPHVLVRGGCCRTRESRRRRQVTGLATL